MSETLRAAIIGVGGIARTHAGYYATNDRIELVAACDISEQRRTEFCDERGIERRYADYQALLDEVRPEIVSVCTWNATHMPIAIAAMEAGARTVISEKPMSDELGGPMDAMVLSGELPCTGAPYDIRKPEAMAWVAAQREGRIRPEGES